MTPESHTPSAAPKAGHPAHRTSESADDTPLRAELFSAAQMALHGRQLAARHVLSNAQAPDRLLARLSDNAAIIARANSELTQAAKAGRRLTPAAEWLLDNSYLIEEQIRTARHHLPQAYSRELPRLALASGAGDARVYQLALEVVAHGDGRLEEESLARFIAAYQEGTPLKLGELWAIPIMLRLALIENLRRISVRLERDRSQRELANDWAERMIASADNRPGDLLLLTADMARAVQPMSASFVAELTRRLQGQGGSLTQVLQWIAARLADEGINIEQQVQRDTGGQAVDQVSIANSIGSLRLLGSIDWREFVETLSAVDQALRTDPAGIYGRMDFATRDLYRHVVERLARQSGQRETEVAAEALALAGAHRSVAEGGLDARTRHVGHYLVGAGLSALCARLNLRRGTLRALRHGARRLPLPSYLGAIGVFTLLFTAALLVHAWHGGAHGALLIALGLLVLFGASQLALALSNLLATRLVAPQPLPRMDFSSGIPSDAHSMVVVPALLHSAANVDALCEALEVHYLANRDPQLRFCLLTDFTDAPSATLPADAALLEQARAAIAALNARYGHPYEFQQHDEDGVALNTRVRVEPFLLLHRPRLWSDSEGAWIGRERKRGKLADLNAFLRGGATASFGLIEGATEGLAAVRYVITLDADTQLPRDSARQCIATMAHPLNQPVLDASGSRVVAGYGLLQPRVVSSLPLEHASRYERLCGGEPGIDPYTRAVSDVYQDLFGEGSFVGKGIYEVDTFELVLGARFPDNLVLSHDLLEGCYVRSGLLSDVQLYEAYPARYSDDVARRRRWIRGDWQLAGWLRAQVPGPDGQRLPNPLSPLARWKLFDNLRRSLVAPALCATLLLCWTLLAAPAFWTAAVLAVFFLPAFVGMLIGLAEKPHDVLWRQHLAHWGSGARSALAHAVLQAAFLPHEACYNLDAIVRSCWRMLVSKRHLLEWKASGLVRSSSQLEANWRSMWFAPALAVGSAVLLSFVHPLALFVAAPLLLLWFLAPLLAWWLSLPIVRPPAQLSAHQTSFLNALARRTWHFFERFVGPEDHWLPPDNMQQHPQLVIAHRTSPTNIGMALLANLTAWDFGFIPAASVLARVRASFDSMALLERYRGHFYNWYDTRTLAPLQPMYVSAVDSGNLAGHLLTLAGGLEQLADAPIASARTLDGLRTTLQVVEETASDTAPHKPAEHGAAGAIVSAGAGVRAPAWDAALAACQRALAPQQCRSADTLPGLADCLAACVQAGAALVEALPADAAEALRSWVACFEHDAQAAHADLLLQAPWMRAVQAYVLDASLTRIPTLRELAACTMAPSGAGASERALAQMVQEGAACAQARLQELAELAQRARAFGVMDFTFLYYRDIDLLAIGYNVNERRLDSGTYDLLASEARLASFVGIAQGQFPQEHWFALGRQLCIVGGEQLLLSWSGSMFEYLMPLLVMPTYRDTLLDQTYHAIIRAQIDYAQQHDIPWGISESGYNTIDAASNYQYRAFGVPGTGLKRGLGDDLVIAPYASMMGLMVEPEAACANLERMAQLGFLGAYGFYEAVDYTATRLPRGQRHAIVRSFMVHHQGMGLLALSYLLHQRPMQQRFVADPECQATLLLLQERVPKSGAFEASGVEAAAQRIALPDAPASGRTIKQCGIAQVQLQLLSNGRYHVMLTSDGGGYSRCNELALTRWREDASNDDWGLFCYLRDLDNGALWSSAWQPTLAQPDTYEATFSEGRAELRRSDDGIALVTEIVVSPEDDIELRRMRIKNVSGRTRRIEVTSYTEAVLAPAAADNAHPAFSKLFVQTEILAAQSAILCTRRPREKEEQAPWLLKLMTVHGEGAGSVSFETSRAQFIGRCNGNRLPAAMQESGPLSGAQGSVLDPALAIRRVITLAPDAEVSIDVVLGAAASREQALQLVAKYQDRALTARVFELAWTHSQVVLRQLNANEADAQLYTSLAGAVLYPQRVLRADADLIARNNRGQSGLWPYAISGDLPIVLIEIRDSARLELARQLVQAHAWWRLKGLVVDLVIWYEDNSGYRQALHDQIMGMLAASAEAQALDRPGGVFVRALDQIPNDDRVLIQSVARVFLQDANGSLHEQMRRAANAKAAPPLALLQRDSAVPAWTAQRTPAALPELLFDNGLGGFSRDGREYLIRSGAAQHTPAPWSNVLASPNFGSVISESGQAYTWGENAHEFRLTPWENDPVADRGGEAFYVRDEASGVYWSPTALPAPSGADYLTRHGFGYSVFEHTAHAISTTLTTFVALDAPLKYSVLVVRNDSSTARRLSVTGYVEWVLGDLRARSALQVVTERDAKSGALFARNAYNTEFAGRVGFFQVDADATSFSCDRSEFIGRGHSLADPQALLRAHLSGTVGAAYDPCAALQVVFELAPGEQKELVFMLGVGGRRTLDASSTICRQRGSEAAAAALAQVTAYWDETLGAVQVETPDPALDVLANGWLVYQTIACRMWARSGYYQSGGAFGFRDQLQDAMALVHTRPQLLREHLLLCAAHQFVEGDAQHWWHPPSNRGVRTRCSDDFLWLPLATCRYIAATGDLAVLAESAPYLDARALKAEEESYYDLPGHASESGDLYEHCVRAIRHGLRFGAHGLPLIGSCDWNDGMDRVGIEGRGESVWLGFFMIEVLQRFAELAERRGDYGFCTTCRGAAQALCAQIEEHAWDGDWYRRAYFDDGTPLGSHLNDECQIDSISQSWGVLSGAAPAERASVAMAALDARLVRRDAGLIQLLDPPFDDGVLNPGYIRGYAPGVRENGGQYTHAAIWSAMAFAQMGQGERAWELFDLINPVRHAATPAACARYKVEPYVVAADVYAVAPHIGRGGWSWYTGSAGWMYRLIVESLLGITRNDDRLVLSPQLPQGWPGFKLTYRYRATLYTIAVRSADSDALQVDGVALAGTTVQLVDDGQPHRVELQVARRHQPAPVAADHVDPS